MTRNQTRNGDKNGKRSRNICKQVPKSNAPAAGAPVRSRYVPVHVEYPSTVVNDGEAISTTHIPIGPTLHDRAILQAEKFPKLHSRGQNQKTQYHQGPGTGVSSYQSEHEVAVLHRYGVFRQGWFVSLEAQCLPVPPTIAIDSSVGSDRACGASGATTGTAKAKVKAKHTPTLFRNIKLSPVKSVNVNRPQVVDVEHHGTAILRLMGGGGGQLEAAHLSGKHGKFLISNSCQCRLLCYQVFPNVCELIGRTVNIRGRCGHFETALA